MPPFRRARPVCARCRPQTLLREKPLHELLSEDKRLVQEIRALDSDMQMLVYENYSKFISATDTIRSMKVRRRCCRVGRPSPQAPPLTDQLRRPRG